MRLKSTYERFKEKKNSKKKSPNRKSKNLKSKNQTESNELSNNPKNTRQFKNLFKGILNKSRDQCPDRFHASAHISPISFSRVEGYSTSRRIDSKRGWNGKVESRVTAGSSPPWDFCLIFETCVSLCVEIVHGGCAGEDPFPLDEGVENKFMTRNGNWCVVKPAPYAPDLIGIILAYFHKLNLSAIVHSRLSSDFSFD